MDLLAGSGQEATRKLAQLLGPLAAEYDHVFLDCPPSISLVSENVMHAADVLLVPLIPTTLSVRTLDQLTDFVAGFDGDRPQVRAFFSMVDRRKKLHQEITKDLRPNGPAWPLPPFPLCPSSSGCPSSVPRSPRSRPAARPPAPSATCGTRSQLRRHLDVTYLPTSPIS